MEEDDESSVSSVDGSAISPEPPVVAEVKLVQTSVSAAVSHVAVAGTVDEGSDADAQELQDLHDDQDMDIEALRAQLAAADEAALRGTDAAAVATVTYSSSAGASASGSASAADTGRSRPRRQAAVQAAEHIALHAALVSESKTTEQTAAAASSSSSDVVSTSAAADEAGHARHHGDGAGDVSDDPESSDSDYSLSHADHRRPVSASEHAPMYPVKSSRIGSLYQADVDLCPLLSDEDRRVDLGEFVADFFVHRLDGADNLFNLHDCRANGA